MKKIVCLYCCFIFASFCSSSEYTLSNNNTNVKTFSSSNSGISDDEKTASLKRTGSNDIGDRHRAKRQKKELNSIERIIDLSTCNDIQKIAITMNKLFEKYYLTPKKFLMDLNKYSKEKSSNKNASVNLKNLLYVLSSYNFFYDFWSKKDIDEVVNNDYVKESGLKFYPDPYDY